MQNTVTIGARYHRPGQPRLVYEVVGVRNIDHHPPHAVLVSETPDRRRITVGVGVLTDRRQWQPVETAK